MNKECRASLAEEGATCSIDVLDQKWHYNILQIAAHFDQEIMGELDE